MAPTSQEVVPLLPFWNFSSGTTVERNLIIDSFRGIALGWGTVHSGGVVRNNFIFQSEAGRNLIGGWVESDTGIHLGNVQSLLVEHNTVILGSPTYQGAVELQNTTNVTLRNNLTNRGVWDRGGNSGTAETGERNTAGISDFAVWGEVHLDPGSGAVDDPSADPAIQSNSDIDGDPRPRGAGPDVGADEI